jgi:hypothetical protein
MLVAENILLGVKHGKHKIDKKWLVVNSKIKSLT